MRKKKEGRKSLLFLSPVRGADKQNLVVRVQACLTPFRAGHHCIVAGHGDAVLVRKAFAFEQFGQGCGGKFFRISVEGDFHSLWF